VLTTGVIGVVAAAGVAEGAGPVAAGVEVAVAAVVPPPPPQALNAAKAVRPTAASTLETGRERLRLNMD